jgi:GTP cyclohydrolase II
MNLEISNVATLPTKYGTFQIQSFKEGHKEHLVIFTPEPKNNLLVRIHSECLTGDALGSLKCDCGDQLDFTLKKIAKEKGMLIYLRQEGRNIGLLNKVNAYALQDKGFNTVEANHQLGFESNERNYAVVDTILHYYNIDTIKLITNNPLKVDALSGITVSERIPIVIDSNKHNEAYLKIKKDEMGHLL